MAPAPETAMPSMRRTRKSTSGFSPTKGMDKENATIDFGAPGTNQARATASRKKSRSKSMGPGGLDALMSTSGNRRVSLAAPSRPAPRSILKPTMPVLADIPPLKPRATSTKSSAKASPARSSEDGTKIALRTEEQQQAAAREREERERAAHEKEVKDHREARRKSLANRRVSFAAEATLHTFHEIEYMQDSTTSTESTSRRRSLVAAAPVVAPATEEPATPEPAEDVLGFHSPGGDDSTMYDSDGDEVEVDDDDEHVQEDVESEGSESDSDEGDGATMVTVEGDEATSASIMSTMSAMSGRSASPIESTSDLEEALRLASAHAGAEASRARRERPVGEDEEIIPAFIGWGKKAALVLPEKDDTINGRDGRDDTEASIDMDMDMDMNMDADMEMTRAMGGIIRGNSNGTSGTDAVDPTEEMSMDVTRVYGGILSQQQQPAETESVASSPMVLADETMGEVPMELTMAVGGVLSAADDDTAADMDGDVTDSHGLEDMSMELTTVMGGVLSAMGTRPGTMGGARSRRQTMQSVMDDDEAMDMTVGVGHILGEEDEEERQRLEEAEEKEDMTMEMAPMEMTTALGGILASKVVESPMRTSRLETMSSPILMQTDVKGVPSPATPRARSPKRKSPANTSTTPKQMPPKATTPRQKSPPKTSTIQKASPAKTHSTPRKTASPKTASTTPRSPPKSSRPAAKSPFTTASVLLTPQGAQRLSVFGAPASPKIAEIFSRRPSLVDTATDFVVGEATVASPKPVSRAAVSFEPGTPKESAPAPWEDDRDATQNLRDMIQGLSPKKNPLRGRKSLHVGSAFGLLGKRPRELEEEDEDDEAEADEASAKLVKRLKGNEPSPVKNIRLQQPPSAMETIGRSSRSRPIEAEAANEAQATDDKDKENIHLQEFLDMAGIHFMELDTTKRRPTEVAPATTDAADADQAADSETEELVTAVCKVPVLEMYQHACRELKNYIEEGRGIMREIEAETYEDSPAIFREYMTATPEVRAQLDNQFKNIKMFARLQSKKQWYEWRTKLQQGLQEGMDKTLQALDHDMKVLQERRAAVDVTWVPLRAEYEAAEAELARLVRAAAALGGPNGPKLVAERLQKRELRKRIAERKRETERLQAMAAASRARIVAMKAERDRHVVELEAAKREQEERRSWSQQEISVMKGQVNALEQSTGWAVTGAHKATLTMAYRRQIELVMDVGSQQVDVWYVGGKGADHKATEDTAFFVQRLQSHVRSMAETSSARLLQVVRASWETAMRTAAQIRKLQRTFPTVTAIEGQTLAVRATVLLVARKTKLEVVVRVTPGPGVGMSLSAEARVVYGEPFNGAKMSEFLSARIGGGEGLWVDVVEELREKLLAQGRRREESG